MILKVSAPVVRRLSWSWQQGGRTLAVLLVMLAVIDVAVGSISPVTRALLAWRSFDRLSLASSTLLRQHALKPSVRLRVSARQVVQTRRPV